jgi:hypothetical protein
MRSKEPLPNARKPILCHDTQHNDIQHNDIQHNDSQHKGLVCNIA